MENRSKNRIAYALVVYLGLVGLIAVFVVINAFPDTGGEKMTFPGGGVLGSLNPKFTIDQGLLVLTFFAGIAGSFLHAAQSLVSYIGNKEFEPSWAAWYLMRPWIGGVLGFVLYFAVRAGLVQAADEMNPYGVVAFGMLGGWFSKTTTDKLQEVFQTLFTTDADKKRKNKLNAAKLDPVLVKISPAEVTPADQTLKIIGEKFTQESTVFFGDQKVEPKFLSENELEIDLGQLAERPNGGEVKVRVVNPGDSEHASEAMTITFNQETA